MEADHVVSGRLIDNNGARPPASTQDTDAGRRCWRASRANSNPTGALCGGRPMNIRRRRLLQLAAGLAILPASFGLAVAQDYPHISAARPWPLQIVRLQAGQRGLTPISIS